MVRREGNREVNVCVDIFTLNCVLNLTLYIIINNNICFHWTFHPFSAPLCNLIMSPDMCTKCVKPHFMTQSPNHMNTRMATKDGNFYTLSIAEQNKHTPSPSHPHTAGGGAEENKHTLLHYQTY